VTEQDIDAILRRLDKQDIELGIIKTDAHDTKKLVSRLGARVGEIERARIGEAAVEADHQRWRVFWKDLALTVAGGAMATGGYLIAHAAGWIA
jgi:hypothetical protein